MERSSIGRRIESCLKCTYLKDYESAFIHLIPALDKTAKKRRSSDGVGRRIKEFISDEEIIITAIGSGGRFITKKSRIRGVSFPEAVYKFIRTPISHEGELDPRLIINDTGQLEIGERWRLPSQYIVGLIVSIMMAPENIQERISSNMLINLFGKEIEANEIWGNREMIKQLICIQLNNPNLF